MAKKFLLRWRHGYTPLKTATVLVSDEDAHFLKNNIFHVVYRENRILFVGRKNTHNGRTESLARMIMGAQKGQEVEHINGDALDCRRTNLRFTTTSERISKLRALEKMSRHG